VFKDRCGTERVREVLPAFESGTIVHAGDDVASADYVELFSDVTGLQTVVGDLTGGDESPAAAASAIEFVLEGLHLSKRLNKDAVGSRATYRSR
jgi:magnesium chelatase subunit I